MSCKSCPCFYAIYSLDRNKTWMGQFSPLQEHSCLTSMLIKSGLWRIIVRDYASIFFKNKEGLSWIAWERLDSSLLPMSAFYCRKVTEMATDPHTTLACTAQPSALDRIISLCQLHLTTQYQGPVHRVMGEGITTPKEEIKRDQMPDQILI